MAHSTVVETIEAHLRANFNACPIFIENERQDVEGSESTFLELSFPYARSEQETIGAVGQEEFREEGAFVMTLAVPRGYGIKEGRAWFDTLAALFRGRQIGEVRCWAPQPAVGDDGNGRGPFYLLTMAVPYTFNVLG